MKRIALWALYVVATSVLVAVVKDLVGLQIEGTLFARVVYNVCQQLVGVGMLFILFVWRAG